MPGRRRSIRAMNIRTILIGAGVVAFGGYALYDYYGPGSKDARELKGIEQLEPGLKPPECVPKSFNAKAFAGALQRGRRPQAGVLDHVVRRSAVQDACIPG